MFDNNRRIQSLNGGLLLEAIAAVGDEARLVDFAAQPNSTKGAHLLIKNGWRQAFC